jgi:putative oxidoreductase
MISKRSSLGSCRGCELSLAALRVMFGLSLFLKHGVEKLFHFSRMLAVFPDPIHIGRLPSLLIATASDGVASILLIVGFCTRGAAAFIFANVLIAWLTVHQSLFFGPQADHGELCVLYCAAMSVLIVSPEGRFSLDRMFSSSEQR